MNKSDLTLITGSEGMVGSRFVELFPNKENLHIPREIEFDITNSSQVKALIKSFAFKAVVHFAAFTNVGDAEEQKGNKDASCWQVNVEGTRNLVDAIKPYKDKIQFIQISTDMVFPGSKSNPGPYPEDYKPSVNSENLTWYGYTKAEAERVVLDTLGERATILRLNYPVRAKFDSKLDFIRRPLKLYDEGKLYPMFTDQIISITYIDEMCELLNKIIEENKYGIFHASTPDTTTPYEFVNYMLKKVRHVDNAVEKETLKNYLEKNKVTPLRYPEFGGLKVEETEKRLDYKFSSWKKVIDKLVLQGMGAS